MHSALTPATGGTRFTYLDQDDRLHIEIINPPTDGHPYKTNLAVHVR